MNLKKQYWFMVALPRALTFGLIIFLTAWIGWWLGMIGAIIHLAQGYYDYKKG